MFIHGFTGFELCVCTQNIAVDCWRYRCHDGEYVSFPIGIILRRESLFGRARPFKYEQSYAVWDGQQHIDLATLFDSVLGFWSGELTRLKLDPAAGVSSLMAAREQ